MTNTNCPNCSEWKNDKRGRIASFTIDGVTHFAPDMWLGSRAQRVHGRAGALAGYAAACEDWTEQCNLKGRYEAQQEARKAHEGRSVSTLSPVAQSLMAKHEARLRATA